MTIIEAAACGVPSIMNSGDKIGASLIVGKGASIEIDLQGEPGNGTDETDDALNPAAISSLLTTLKNEHLLQETGLAAQQRALAWDEEAYGATILKLIQKALHKNSSN